MPNAKPLKPIVLYRRLMKRNRELEQIIRMLKKEQEENGTMALRLVVKFPEVAKAHKQRK